MNLDREFNLLDKQEFMIFKEHHLKLKSIRDEYNFLIYKHWDKVKEESILTKSIISRLENFYRFLQSVATEEKKEKLGPESGTYLEDIIYSSLTGYLNFSFQGSNVQLKSTRQTSIYLKTNGKWIRRIPDIVLSIKEKKLIALEIKVNLLKSDLDRYQETKELMHKNKIDYYIIASYVGPDLDEKLSKWIRRIGTNWRQDGKTGFWSIEPDQPIEQLFEEIGNKIRAYIRDSKRGSGGSSQP